LEGGVSGLDEVREGLGNRLSALANVVSRHEFGNEAFYLGETKFAALTDRALVLHLPAREITEALKTRQARPFVSVGALNRHGWIEIPLSGGTPLQADLWIGAAYRAAQHSHRRSRAKKPAPARRLKKSTGTGTPSSTNRS
jgi:hypothetical protein